MMNKNKQKLVNNLKAINSIKKYLLCILIIILAFYSCGMKVKAQDKALQYKRAYEIIDQYIKQHLKETKAPGFAIALTSRVGLLHEATYGYADIKTKDPVTPATLFEIGSISKSFTAIALLQMQEKGEFAPNKPVTTYLPWFQVKTKYEPITCHHLLTHSAGIPVNRDDILPSLYQSWALRYQSTAYPPGKKFYYSNIGYQTLHFILEAVSGGRYADVILKGIFEPLEMNSSVAAITHDTRKRLAVGYQYFYDDRPHHFSHPLVEATWVEYDVGDGCIASTPKDMAAYVRMLLNRGKGAKKRVLSEKSFETFSTPYVLERGKFYYGYGIDVARIDGHTYLGHGGGMVGYRTYILADLDDGLGVATFVNGPGNPSQVAWFALKALQAALHNKDMPKIPKPKDRTKIKNASEYTTTYTAHDGKQITLVVEGEHLILFKDTKKTILEQRGKDEFFLNHPEFNLFLVRFGRDKDNKVVELTYGNYWYINSNYSGPVKFKYPKKWEAYTGHYRTQNPWFNNFRVLLRKGQLILATSDATESQEGEEILTEIKQGLFKIGKEETAERLRFDTIINGKAQRANFSGVDFYRVNTP